MGFFYKSIVDGRFFKALARAVLPVGLANRIRRKVYANKNIRLVFGLNEVVLNCNGLGLKGVIPVVYWDGLPNFGDMIGPYLISKITGYPVLNIIDSAEPGFMTVGSIMHHINRRGMIVWGSGLIEQPTEQLMRLIKKYEPEILSVRGKETAGWLKKAGVKVSNLDALGDPALIMPLFYTPSLREVGGLVTVCPHYTHKSRFLECFSGIDGVGVVDVQRDLEYVVDSISSSKVCISTSLHGLIISQAYGVPWVWLEVVDNNLRGDDFKFRDFFSTLNESQVVRVRVAQHELAGLDLHVIASKAVLPDKRYKEELILGALKTRLASLGEP
ncbi:polysaccharide pyruvyl transferase family protein [Pseudomonas sp. MYb185]|uniref:polysaccharide pyruvyl transferase family protein n=1 Tax=Pseudomonas sp. MYb185 TaxID=1848729 RepID=UPI000CFC5015|nr:polysaccharide pyruvyl transferase family protein [Pseudomonas sp. MYb185]PRB75442.1 hypothetical protein CQ007_17950 [Pseudomonas sp. MYb185]